MEFILEPEQKTKYEKCKKKVKYWEHQFKKLNGRLPSKLDIREASIEIRYAYKTYFNLKSVALEASFQDIDGFGSDDDQENSSIAINMPNSTEPNIHSGNNLNDSLVTEEEGQNVVFTEKSKSLENVNTEPKEIIDNVNSNKTWGNHLNNIAPTKVLKTNSFDASTSFTKKLFKNSAPSKRNLRKSLSFLHGKSETSLNVSENNSFSLSQPNSSFSSMSAESQDTSTTSDTAIHDHFNIRNILNTKDLRMTKPIEPVRTNSLNVVQAVLSEQFDSVRNVDVGWMKRVAGSAGTKMVNKSLGEDNFVLSHQLNTNKEQNIDNDSDDIIGDSDEEEDAKLHFNKRRKLNNTNSQQHTQNNQNQTPSASLSNEIRQILPVLIAPIIDETKANTEEEIKPKDKSVTKPRIALVETSETLMSKPVAIQTDDVPTRKSTRSTKTLIDFNEQEDEDRFAFDEDEDPDFSLHLEIQQVEDRESGVENNEEKIEALKKKSKSSKAKKSVPKKKSYSKSLPKKCTQNREEEVEDEVQNTYELEFSIKPRRVICPRDSDFKKVIKKSKVKTEGKASKLDQPLIKTAHQQKLEKLEQKMKSGNLNDNYVRVNIEKKVYARGKKSINFSKYKKKMWRQNKKDNALCGPNMDMRGCDGGQLTCFNCGQVGHFAQKCPMQKAGNLLPLPAGEETYCPFPTLEEASEMAQMSRLAVRKTRNAEATVEKDCPFGNAENSEKQTANQQDAGSGVTHNDDSESDDEDSDNKGEETVKEMNMFSDDDDGDLLAETLKLEDYVKKVDMQQFIDDSTVIKPYYSTKENGSLIDTPQEVFDALEMFGHLSFRDGQEKTIMRILSGQSTLVTLSTGSGKSLCYQIPAYLLTKREPCIALVISPLVSLMEDQVTGIPKFLKAECLHTNKTKLQRERILNAIATGDLHILLVSPEAVVAGEKQTGFGSLLRKLPPIAFACIDEAHCVSQWSHNFRPSYLMICRILKERLGVKTILGLTATATRATSDSIIEHLSIPDGRNGIISDIPLPNNLRLTVSKDGNRDNALMNLLLSERFQNLKSIIIYCIRRLECERIASLLRIRLKNEKNDEGQTEDGLKSNKRKRKKLEVHAEPYHAGLPASKRKSIQNSFMRGDLRIVVATVAFGMGINKSDIRAVIHYNLPKNFESYVQEVGRAGRDGLPAHCHLFLDAQGRDEDELQKHIFSDSIDRHVIRKLNSKIFIPCTCKGICPKHEVAFSVEKTVQALDIPEENISTLLCYLELHSEKYIEVLSPAYITCKITAYGTANFIRKAAHDCPPLAMALALFGNKDNETDNVFEFPIVEVASAIGWDSGICKYTLKNLEWTTENGQPKRSYLTVQFFDLGFRLLAPGNLSDEQLDQVLDSLHSRVQDQEKCALLQLRSLHETVTACAEATYRQCIGDEASEKEIVLKERIRQYFESAQPLSTYELKPKNCDEGLIANDCRAMLSMYRDNEFTGRALARIFYGIQSPNYPAVIWGRCKYWRAHIGSDFHKILQIATKEILKYK